MKYFHFLQSLCLLVLCTTCALPGDDEYYVKLQKPIPPYITIQSNILSDSIIANYDIMPLWFKIESSLEDVHVVKIVVSLNDYVVASNYMENTLSFSVNDLSYGTFQLHLEITVNSGTGSIADKIGNEGYTFTTSDITLIKHNGPGMDPIYFLPTENGLELKWRKRLQYDSYEIEKSSSPNIYMQSDVIETTSLDTVYTDTRYVGEGCYYQVFGVSGKTRYRLGNLLHERQFPAIRPALSNGKLGLSWNRIKPEQNLKQIDIYKSSGSDFFSQFIGSISKTDTFFSLDNSLFGTINPYVLVFVPVAKMLDDAKSPYMANYYDILQVSGPDLMYVLGHDQQSIFSESGRLINRYIISENKTDTLADNIYHSCMSASGDYILYQQNSNLILAQTEPFEVLSTAPVPGAVYLLSLSDNGMACISTLDGMLIQNMFSKQILVNEPKLKYSEFWGRISPDGEYLLVTHSTNYYSVSNQLIYHFTSNELSFIDSTEGYYLRFLPGHDHQLFRFLDNDFQKINANDLQIVQTIHTVDPEFRNIDILSKRFLTKSETACHIYDLESGNLLYTIPKQPGYNAYLVNSTVFFEYGNKYSIQ
ncbi:MAG: hypothetical protein U0T82_06510 [Bacteroidales bacterium]